VPSEAFPEARRTCPGDQQAGAHQNPLLITPRVLAQDSKGEVLKPKARANITVKMATLTNRATMGGNWSAAEVQEQSKRSHGP